MSSSAVSKQTPQEVSQGGQQGIVETKEANASANASAGINLNLFGAIAGAFSGKSEKETAPDGSSTEDQQAQADVKGVGAGNLNAIAAASGEENARQTRAAIKQTSS